ncbi:MAG TPA: zf-HC2 domain-containing protein, partial [Gemmataceae bacterium]|nr:zf-HC2 domain-containing protein [Gemmataceae bacterium]
MATCRHYQAQMLDRLYDLLDAADARALDLHLSTCPACKAAMGQSERVQRLLAAAAKTEFPGVKFQAPAAGAEVARAAVTSPPRRSFWRAASLAVAACLFMALGIPSVAHLATARRQQDELSLAQARVAERQESLRALAAMHNDRLARAQADVNAAQSEFQNQYAELTKKLAEAERSLHEKELYFVISGPSTLQPGATNEYRVDTYNFQNKPAAANMAARVKDQAEKVVFETSGKSAGTWSLKLPPDLPLTPKRELFLEVTAEGEAGKAQLREQVQLAVPQFMTHVTTDKPMYQPGETVHFRSLTLDRFTLKPPADDFALQYVIRDSKQTETVLGAGVSRVAGADGQPILGPDGQPVKGVGAGDYQIPSTAMGGEYTLAVRDLNGRFAEERRKFIVNEYRPHRLHKELEWSRSSYGPGDAVVANCKVTDASGPVVGTAVSAEANVDGTKVPATPSGPTDARGTVAVRFTLPKEIDRGLASLTVSFGDGGNVEPLTKPIPVALKKLFIDFYPEGGELVAGVPNRVYFQARTTLDKPADVRGRIVDGTGKTVADAATLSDDKEPGINQGHGRVAFTPEFGQTYELKIDTLAGTEGEHKLPAVKPEGVVLTSLDDASADPAPLRVRVTSAGIKRDLLVGCYARGRLLDHSRISLD